MSTCCEQLKKECNFIWTGPWVYCGSYPGHSIPVYGTCSVCGKKVEHMESDLRRAFTSEQIAFAMQWKEKKVEDTYYPKRAYRGAII